ncbi:MAG: thioesterase family protein [Parvibaculum sp.]|uniref:thioesterase family protein n=2 Tax=Parvibaculum sp. TaxID=2024848 RepID=UPI002730AE59|nr:thioesterase family protein [Parvibaculum sp.]MDP1626989.1 thioesterase family protein [Parvibaculum sp.]MDP2149783.1 thioesterase family protein [Parvibaculum sp.]
MTALFTAGQPLECPLRKVEKQWVDFNGHLNMAYYHVLFDESLDVAFTGLGIGWDYTKQGEGSCFTAEVHVCYLDELKEGDPVRVTYQLLDADAKRIHVFGHMYHAEKGYLAATSEQMCIHVDMKSRRASPFPDMQMGRIADLMKAHEGMPRPEQAGRVIGIKRK